MTKMALTGDVHFGARAAREIQHNQDIKDFFNWMAEDCKARGVPELTIAGDVFEHRDKITLQSMSDATEVFAMCEREFEKVTVLRGNHDLAKLDTLSPCSLEPFQKYFDLINEYKIDRERKVMWTSWICNEEQFDELVRITKEEGIKVLIGHFEFAGFKFNDHALCEHGLNLSALSHIPVVLTGHFHTTQQRTLQSTGTRCLYLGSPFPTSFTEKNGTHGYWILDTETLELEQVVYDKIKFIDVSPADLIAGKVDIAQCTNVRVVMTEEPDKETLEQVDAALREGGFRDSKLSHKFSRTEDKLSEQASDVAIEDIQSIDELVMNHLSAMDTSANDSVDKSVLVKLYRQAVQGVA